MAPSLGSVGGGGDPAACLAPQVPSLLVLCRHTLPRGSGTEGSGPCPPGPQNWRTGVLSLSCPVLPESDLALRCVISAKLNSVKEVLHFSGPDLQRLTGLSGPDVQRLLRAASSHLRGSGVLTGGQVGEDGPALPTPLPGREPCLVAAPRPGRGHVQRAAGRSRGTRWRDQDTRGPRGHQASALWAVSGPCPQRRGRGRGTQGAGSAGNQTAPCSWEGPLA